LWAPAIGNLEGTGTHGGNGYPDEKDHVKGFGKGPVKTTAVLHESGGPRDRRPLLDKIGKIHLEMRGLGIEPFLHLLKDACKGPDVDLPPIAVQDLHEPAHVGTFELVWEVHGHIDAGDRVLKTLGLVKNDYRVRDIRDPHPVEGDHPVIW